MHHAKMGPSMVTMVFTYTVVIPYIAISYYNDALLKAYYFDHTVFACGDHEWCTFVAYGNGITGSVLRTHAYVTIDNTC